MPRQVGLEYIDVLLGNRINVNKATECHDHYLERVFRRSITFS